MNFRYYIKTTNLTGITDIPEYWYEEIDCNGQSIRTIEFYHSGDVGWTERALGVEHGGAIFPDSHSKDLEDMLDEPLSLGGEYIVEKITSACFERVWLKATKD